MSARRDAIPYTLERIGDAFVAVQPETGLRVEGRDIAGSMAAMHRAMLDRRDGLAARDPATLTADEQRDLDHLRSFADGYLRAGALLDEPLPPRRADGGLPAVGPWPTGLPYEIERHSDGSYTVHDPVTGLRADHGEFKIAIDRMHRLLLERRAALERRDPENLSREERRDLAHLRSCPEQFLQAGRLSAGLVA